MVYYCSIMENVLPNKIELFFSQFPRQALRKGQTVIAPGEEPAGAFYIRRGYVREYNISVEGIEITIHIFVPSTFFPMTSIIGDIKNRYYFEALSDAELYCAPKDAVNAFLKDNPDMLYNLTKRLLIGLDKLTLRIEQLAYAKASTRMISALLFLAGHFGKTEGSNVIITEKFTHREIAAFACVTRETASREWKKLQDTGLISADNQFIIIHNIHNLQKKLEE